MPSPHNRSEPHNTFAMKITIALTTTAISILLLTGCAPSQRNTPVASHPDIPKAPQEVNIPITPENKASANKLIKLLYNLERAEMGNVNSIKGELAEVKKQAETTQLGDLPCLQALILYWDLSISGRAGTIEEHVTVTDGTNTSRVLSASINGDADAQLSKTAKRAGIELHARANYENNRSTTFNGNRSIKFEGSLKDSTLRTLREQSRVQFFKELRRLGLELLPKKTDLVGKWSWRWTYNTDGPATVKFNLKPDFTMDAQIVPDNPADWPGRGWVDKGRGNWSIDEGKLRVKMLTVSIFGIQKDNPLTFIDSRKVTWFDESQIMLDGDNDKVLERQ